jgi:hypothetical protein
MMQLSNQYNSFLGGEVSESLWYRADMDKFGKWFANAENIRFTTMGSFTNRPGFVRVGPVLDHQLKPVVKLIPFVFNNEEVFEIEFITGKFRVRKHGEVIKREDGSEVVYDSPIKIESLQQLKYAQSGDIIFIASGTSPVMELRRLKTDGTEWELVQFKSDLPPLGEENDDKKNNVAITKVSSDEKYYKKYILKIEPIKEKTSIYPEIVLNSGEVKTLSLIQVSSLKELASALSRKTGDWYCGYYGLAFAEGESGDFLYIYATKETLDVKSLTLKKEFSITRKTSDIQSFTFIQKYYATPNLIYSNCYQYRIPMIGDGFFPNFAQHVFSKYKDGSYIDSETVSYLKERSKIGNLSIYPKNIQEAIPLFNNYGENATASERMYHVSRVAEDESYFDLVTQIPKTIGSKEPKAPVLQVGYAREVGQLTDYINFETDEHVDVGGDYKAVFDKNTSIDINSVFGIKKDLPAAEITETVTSNDIQKFNPVYGGSKWRYYTSGNWKGKITIFYSNDSGETWKKLRTTVSNQTAEPGIFNENTSGTIEGEDLLLYKIEVEKTDGTVNINFYTNAIEVNSYYKNIAKINENTYYLDCVKNNSGEIESTPKWRLSSFSESSGYPESIGFYQNRLFLAKGYELWGSKINDFWDFYEPIDLQKDDPVNISILSYKVNTIKDMLTTKSFFVFTTGGEFGIASQGAISQDDKYLKQFSSHGINNCTPLVVGNLVIFVDATGNTVRAFQYSFESDSYEATDVSLFLEEKLKNKQIITAEYIKSTKECLFLDDDGVIWVFKYMPEQNIMSWSHWKHGRYKITNLCVTPNGAFDELYVVVDAPDGKFIERLDSSVYSDSVEIYTFEEDVEEVQTQLYEGTVVNVDDSVNNKYKATVDEFGKVKLRSPSNYVKIGLSYTSTGTLLTPTISLQDGSFTTYRKQRINKVFFVYRDSFGFKVGEEGKEKMEVEFTTTDRNIEESTSLASGKKSVLIPDSYDSASRVSFVQSEPYPMYIVNVLLESDYGGQ